MLYGFVEFDCAFANPVLIESIVHFHALFRIRVSPLRFLFCLVAVAILGTVAHAFQATFGFLIISGALIAFVSFWAASS